MPLRDLGAIFLLTDYGLSDEFVGVVHAVLAHQAPGAPVIDLSHGISPGDVWAGAHALQRCSPHLGPGVVVAVVDPGVGTGRRAVAVEVDGAGGPRWLVGPDNGVLDLGIRCFGGARRAFVLGSPPAVPRAQGGSSGRPWVPTTFATTFDGRDVFAPAAARLWSGIDASVLGSPVPPGDLIGMSVVPTVVADRRIDTVVTWVDRFGNVQLAAEPDHVVQAAFGPGPVQVEAGGRHWTARPVLGFAELGPAELGLLVDANARLSLVTDRRSAAAVLGVRQEQAVVLWSRA